MINKPINTVSWADLQELVSNKTQENKTLEYKRDFVADSNEDRKKILRTICAFANTAGGDLLYGIEALEGIPTALPGIDIPDEDGFRLRLENSVRDGIQPRLTNIQIAFIANTEMKRVVLVRVEKSWSAPHRLNQDGNFFGRNSAGTYSLDVGELRQAFIFSETIVERIRAFWADRILKISRDAGPVALVDGVKVVFEMIPVSSFSKVPAPRIELTPTQKNAFTPMGASATHSQINLDGYYCYTYSRQAASKAYTQVFRNGSVETVCSFEAIPDMADKPVPSLYLETQLIRLTGIYRRNLLDAGVTGPFLFFLAILNVSNSRLLVGRDSFVENLQLTQREVDALILPEVLTNSENFDIAQTLKPLFDSYWNAYGLEGSQNYDEQGNWIS